MIDSDGSEQRLPGAFISGPSSFPRMFRVEPHSEFIAVVFRPAGLFACFGIPTNLFHGKIVALDDFLPAADVAAFLEKLCLAQDTCRITDVIDNFLLQSMLRRCTQPKLLPMLSLATLMLPVSELSSQLGIGPRQLERRFLINHGMPLRDCRRLARFVAALMQLFTSPPQQGQLADIAQEARYVDQAHFTRDFRQFVGETPAKFMKARQQENFIYQLWQLGREELPTYLD